MIGLDAGEYPLTLEQIYVPLRATGRMAMPAEHGRTVSRVDAERLDAGMHDIELSQLFVHATAARPHIVLLGEPGAGKSTALRKLLSLCCDGTGGLAGLAPDVVPVLLPLRHVKAEDLPAETAPTKRGPDALSALLLRCLGAADHATVWPQSQVLLLLDGLDEVPDALRPRVARWLRNELPRHRHLRVVVTSRIASYTKEVELGEKFSTLEVRPLQPTQIVDFVRLWFQAVQPAVRNLDADGAAKAADRLIDTLRAEQYSNQQLMSLVGSPLLLTLLCIVVLRGGVMPKQRVQFYEICLRILLETWRKARGVSEPLLPPHLAVEVLAPVAYSMHKDNQQELDRATLANRIDEQVLPRRRDVDGYEVLSWLHQGAGLLRELVGDTFKFSHLGFQEYLAALHLSQYAATELAHLVAHAGEKWWLEVALLFVAMPGRATFGPFVRELLASKDPVQHEDLIRAALETASQPDIAPLLDALEVEKRPVRQAFLLRLLHGRLDPRLSELARTLCRSKDKDVQARAAQILDHEQRQRGNEDVLVLHAAAVVGMVQSLRVALASRGTAMRSFALESRQELAEELPTLLKFVHDLVVVTRAADKAAWADARLQPLVAPLARRVQRCIEWRAGSSTAEVLPAGVRAIDRRLEGPEDLAQWLVNQRVPAVAPRAGAGAGAAAGVRDQAPPDRFGIRFVAVPAGEFDMGFEGQSEAKPIHRVQMSAFWLAETSVTNAQYRSFLEATKAAPPMYWGDRRFGADEQPVVGVSWHDAKAFCAWLGTELQRTVALPSEAQREYAARGNDGRPFPWGAEEPDTTRACFGSREPKPVGSFPAGRGPFGHLDLSGNVWEWCEDVWNEAAYGRRKGLVRDPLETEGNRDSRCLRGGGWSNSAGNLRVGIRIRSPADYRNFGIGFRVAISPASTA